MWGGRRLVSRRRRLVSFLTPIALARVFSRSCHFGPEITKRGADTKPLLKYVEGLTAALWVTARGPLLLVIRFCESLVIPLCNPQVLHQIPSNICERAEIAQKTASSTSLDRCLKDDARAPTLCYARHPEPRIRVRAGCHPQSFAGCCEQNGRLSRSNAAR